MDLSFIAENYMPIVVLACLIIGYCIKNISWLDGIANEYIPTVMAVLGAILGCVSAGFSLESMVAGAVSGLASTGVHQAFKQIINRG